MNFDIHSLEEVQSQSVLVRAQVNAVGRRGSLLGRIGASGIASGVIPTPESGLVLWQILEHVFVKKKLQQRSLVPAEDGQSLDYTYTVEGGKGGLFSTDEVGHLSVMLVVTYAPPLFLTEIGPMKIISTFMPGRGPDADLPTCRMLAPGWALKSGSLMRLHGEDSPLVWNVED